MRTPDRRVRSLKRLVISEESVSHGTSTMADTIELAAVKRALDRAGFAIVSSGMRECASSPDGLTDEDRATMEKLFLTLS